MSAPRRRRNTVIVLVLLLLLILLLLLRCSCKPELPAVAPGPATASPAAASEALPPASATVPAEADERLTPATLTAPEQVTAGAAFAVAWTGPDNRGDYVTLVPSDAPATQYGSYQETERGSPLELTAPIAPGAHELRYVTARSHTVLARRALAVVAAEVTLEAAPEVLLGASLSVRWTGPDNRGDYITLVAREMPDGQYGNCTDTSKGSPLSVTAPSVAGEAELRYMTGQKHQVLARRAVRIVAPDVSLSAAAEALAGSTLAVTWTGPNNAGDYITVVARETPDGQYGNYELTAGGSPLALLLPILSGEAELRYMTGQGNKVLARRALTLRAAEVTLSAPDEATAGASITITWTGPDHAGDYITVVPRATPDGQYGPYTETRKGSPLSVTAPRESGEAEVRYMTGQGNQVLARRALRIVP